MRTTNPFVRHVNGGACFTDFDYNVEDGKTYYCENDSIQPKDKEEKARPPNINIVSVSDQRQLMNGFRYIKDQLLQNHNFHMYDAYEKFEGGQTSMFTL